jgi:ABC-type phosphate transport system substrate-binding protein
MRALAITALFVVAFATAPRAADHTYKVIVHPDNPITDVQRDFLRNAYLKKARAWSDGATVRPIDMAPKAAVRDRFTRDVLKKSPAQLKNYWNQQIFSGKALPPPEAKTPEEVIAYVLANPGAVGYLPSDVDAGGAKVVGIK